MGGRLPARFADNFSFIHGLFLKCGAAIHIEGINSMISRIQLKTRGLPSVDYLLLKLRQLTSPSFTRLF